ncbi:MAG: hypothetical protein ICV60_05640 [Pyrinomonadaceae bacterium]|nr:hypothetical protein [Pyrinomonadaceae bacterium]
MNEELRNKILADLDKTGFGSEMRALKVFSQAQWLVSGASSYYDLDSSITREIDIQAHIRRAETLDNGKKIECFYQLVAEVKKSKSPWIVFKSITSWDKLLLDAWQNLIFDVNLPAETTLTKSISDLSLVGTLGWRGSSIHEGFKEPTAPSRWYPAFVAACKASESSLEANSWAEEAQAKESKNSIHLFFVKPLVIFDGILISAELTDNGEVLLNEIDSAPFDFSYQSQHYTRRRYSVDVVKLSALSDYLQLSKTRLDAIFNSIKDGALSDNS